jgi:hypothetical protein
MFISENEMGGECSTHGEEICTQDFLLKPLGRKGGKPLGRPRRGWGIILKWI